MMIIIIIIIIIITRTEPKFHVLSSKTRTPTLSFFTCVTETLVYMLKNV